MGDLPLLAGLGLVVLSFFTSALTAAFGIGGGVALLAVMGFAMPVSSLIPVHGAVQLGSNAGRLWVQRAHVALKQLSWFAAGALVGALAGVPMVIALDEALLKTVLGAFILAVTWVKMPAIRSGGDRAQAAFLAAGGALTTFATMFVGATGPLAAAFLQRSASTRHAYAATHAAVMSVQHGLKVAVFALAGFAFADWFALVAAMVASGYAGTLAGSRLLDRLSGEAFAVILRWLVTLLALLLVFRGLAGMV